jgi:hypothetical protein
MQNPLTRLPKYEFKLTREQILFIPCQPCCPRAYSEDSLA